MASTYHPADVVIVVAGVGGANNVLTAPGSLPNCGNCIGSFPERVAIAILPPPAAWKGAYPKGDGVFLGLTISAAQDMMQDLRLAIANAVQDFVDRRGLLVYLSGGPSENSSWHGFQIQVQVPGAKGRSPAARRASLKPPTYQSGPLT